MNALDVHIFFYKIKKLKDKIKINISFCIIIKNYYIKYERNRF